MTEHRSTKTAPLPPGVPTPPAELAVVQHSVGYTEVVLSSGDRIRLHLFVDRFRWSEDFQSFTPDYRVVTEVQPKDMSPERISGALQECWRC